MTADPLESRPAPSAAVDALAAPLGAAGVLLYDGGTFGPPAAPAPAVARLDLSLLRPVLWGDVPADALDRLAKELAGVPAWVWPLYHATGQWVDLVWGRPITAVFGWTHLAGVTGYDGRPLDDLPGLGGGRGGMPGGWVVRLDAPDYQVWSGSVARHELMHVVDYLLGGPSTRPDWLALHARFPVPGYGPLPASEGWAEWASAWSGGTRPVPPAVAAYFQTLGG